MSTDHTTKELREFERRRGENSDDSGSNIKNSIEII